MADAAHNKNGHVTAGSSMSCVTRQRRHELCDKAAAARQQLRGTQKVTAGQGQIEGGSRSCRGLRCDSSGCCTPKTEEESASPALVAQPVPPPTQHVGPAGRYDALSHNS
jgi:hypothetical protein